MITQNQQRFIDLLNAPDASGGGGGGGGGGSGEGGILSGQPGMPPGTVAIQVTPQEKEAIERVCYLENSLLLEEA